MSTHLANKADVAEAMATAVRHAVCTALANAGDCGNRRHGDCLRCRAATKGALTALDDFARNAVIEVPAP